MPRKARASKSNELLPVILIGLGALLVVAVLIWQVVQSARQGSLTGSPPNQPAAPPAANQSIPEPGIERVTLADARAALDAQSAVFLDVRDPVSFEAGHIPGSVNIPITELETRVSELDPNQWIITYCT